MWQLATYLYSPRPWRNPHVNEHAETERGFS
jgi:hypothetical protein